MLARKPGMRVAVALANPSPPSGWIENLHL